MPRTRLNEALSTLHDQLTVDAPLDDADRQHLAQVLADIRSALDRSDGELQLAGDQPAQDLSETIARFESSHPAIAAGLHQIVDSLRRL